jgi:hypothetical protein
VFDVPACHPSGQASTLNDLPSTDKAITKHKRSGSCCPLQRKRRLTLSPFFLSSAELAAAETVIRLRTET